MLLISSLSPENCLFVNVSAIGIFGLEGAVYISEVARACAEANSEGPLVLNRERIALRTGLSEDRQHDLDARLSEFNVIELDGDAVSFDLKSYLALISSDDVGYLGKVRRKMQAKGHGKQSKAERERRTVERLRKRVSTGNRDIDKAICDWIDETRPLDSRLTASTVDGFVKTVLSFSKGNVEAAIRVAEIAKEQKWLNPIMAIDAYMKEPKEIVKQSASFDGLSEIKF